MNESVREERLDNLIVRVIELPRCDSPTCTACRNRPDWFYFWAARVDDDRWMCVADAQSAEVSMPFTAKELDLFERLAVAWGVPWELVEGFTGWEVVEMGRRYESLVENMPSKIADELRGQSVEHVEEMREQTGRLMAQRENARWN